MTTPSEPSWRLALRVAVQEAGPGALASGRSAALLHGIRIGSPRPTLWVPGGRSLPGMRPEQVEGIACVDVVTMLLLLCEWRGPPDVVSAARSLGVPLDDLHRRCDTWLAAHGSNPRAVRSLLDELDDVAAPDSALESRFTEMLRRAGLRDRAVIHHVVSPPGSTRAYELDVAFVDECVAVELDGWEYHRSRDSFQGDRRRDVELIAAGWVVLRFTHTDVTRRPAWVVAQIRRTLAARRG